MSHLQNQYDYLIACSKEVWGEQTQGGGVSAKKRIEEIDKQRKLQTLVALTPAAPGQQLLLKKIHPQLLQTE